MGLILKKSRIIEILRGLRQIRGYDNFQFKYAIRRNIDKLEPIIKPIEDMELDNLKIIQDYTIERLELCKRYCSKDDTGEPVLIDGNMGPKTSYDFTKENKAVFEKELEELKEKHKEALDKFREKEKEIQGILETDETFGCYCILKAHVPHNISDADFDTIYELLEQDQL